MSANPNEWSVFSKASIILGIAAAIWLAWYCVAVAATKPAPVTPLGDLAPVEWTRVEAGNARAIEDPVRARLERLSEREMKQFYSRCSQEGAERRLDGGEAMACSIGYDVLLNKHFDGDFERLLSWSRSDRLTGSR